ncbi:MAG: hydantoinase/oxoprolinase family protein [Desulfovibrio sp.]|nr:hydantoinase/oxoprolinase family protein [Desulfovibrio sp.]
MPRMRLLAQAKVPTRHDDLPASVGEVLATLARALNENAATASLGGAALLGRASRVTLGATLAVNALVQDKADAVGLVLSAGPGLDPRRFALGEHVCVVPGGLDHRGTEISPLMTDALENQAARWREEGIAAVACVGKFSPRNPAHEQRMAQAVSRGVETSARGSAKAAAADAPCITLGHRLSGRLNFPRRIATAYFNAAVQRLHARFLDAVENALAKAGVRAAVRLLKADGGAVPLSLSRLEPVQSILSGPAASVMGTLALCAAARKGCALLLDIGGTTTDMALVVEGSPVVDRDGMILQGRRTLVRTLASVSIGVGGDSQLTVNGHGAEAFVGVGPERQGPAMAFGGSCPTLLDALNALHSFWQNEKVRPVAARPYGLAGDVSASLSGLQALARHCGLEPQILARRAVEDALKQISRAAKDLVAGINAQPIYTLAGLRALQEAHPARAWLVGGPAACIGPHLAEALGMPVDCPPHTAVANAVGAALTLPTDALEVYAETGCGLLRAPALDLAENIRRGFSLEALGQRARELLLQRLEQAGADDASVEITEAESFATLEENGFGSKDMRVSCQAVPGLAGLVVQES